MALEEDLVERATHTERKVRGARALLKEAQDLAVQIESLLETPILDADEACIFRMRLARAHTLGLLDQLEELVGPAFGRGGPGLRDCGTGEVAVSGERARVRGANF
jgi:hypothetical protein